MDEVYNYYSQCSLSDVNKGFARVTGGTFNCRAEYGLEIPCVYYFYGPKPYNDKLCTISC